MMRLFLLMLLIPSTSFATLYTLDASNSLRFGSTANEVTSWQSVGTGFRCPACPPVTLTPPPPGGILPTLPFTNGTLAFRVTPAGHTQLTFGGLLLIDAPTTQYNSTPGIPAQTFSQFSSSFTGWINPALVEGVLSDHWTGTLTATFPTDAFETRAGLWSLHASTEMPEPSTLALIAPVLASLWLWRRRITASP